MAFSLDVFDFASDAPWYTSRIIFLIDFRDPNERTARVLALPMEMPLIFSLSTVVLITAEVICSDLWFSSRGCSRHPLLPLPHSGPAQLGRRTVTLGKDYWVLSFDFLSKWTSKAFLFFLIVHRKRKTSSGLISGIESYKLQENREKRPV